MAVRPRRAPRTRRTAGAVRPPLPRSSPCPVTTSGDVRQPDHDQRASGAAPDAARPEGTPAVPREDAGPRPGEHPSVARSGSSPSTAWILVGLLVLGALLYAGVWFGMLGGNAG